MDIDEKAQELEKKIEDGQFQAVGEELHNMSKTDRLAVAKQIKADQQQQPSDDLPRVDFYSSGDLKSSDTLMDDTEHIHTEYDRNGKRKSEDYTNSDNDASSHWKYDTRTGNSVSGTYRYEDGTTDHSEYNPNTGGRWRVEGDANGNVVTAKGTDGRTRKFHYDDDHKLDQIDGHLGHWDRVDQEGKTIWVNRDTKAQWEGDFRVDSKGNLTFESGKGTDWTFTRDGQDMRKRR